VKVIVGMCERTTRPALIIRSETDVEKDELLQMCSPLGKLFYIEVVEYLDAYFEIRVIGNFNNDSRAV
jgi:hypothetical protein